MRFSLQAIVVVSALAVGVCSVFFLSIDHTAIKENKNVAHQIISANDRPKELTVKYPQNNRDGEFANLPHSQSGKLINVESEPGSYYLTVQQKSGQEVVLNTPTLLRATMFGPPVIGNEIYWQVRALNNDVHSRLLNKTFKKVYFVKLTPKLPQSGVVKSVRHIPDGLEILVSSNVAGKGNVALLLQYQQKNENEKVQLKEGNIINWGKATLVLPSLSKQKIPQIAISTISKK